MRVELIRHGETLWQGTGRYQGQTDVPLSEQGRQALSPASFSPEKVYITALQRTRQTAERLFPQARLVVVEDLGEMNFGRFEGRSAAEMEEDQRELVASGLSEILDVDYDMGGGHVPGTMSRRRESACVFPPCLPGLRPTAGLGGGL